jgi:hypothetical protein
MLIKNKKKRKKDECCEKGVCREEKRNGKSSDMVLIFSFSRDHPPNCDFIPEALQQGHQGVAWRMAKQFYLRRYDG